MKTYRIKSDKIINAKIKSGYVYFKGKKIIAVTKDELPFDEEIDAKDCYLSAGFIDSHTHGAFGYDFATADVEGIKKAVNYHFSHGTTSILPTTLSADKNSILSSLGRINEAMTDKNVKADIIGVHLEGPYFSLARAGAQNPEYITEPIEKDYKEIIEKYGSIIKKWSYAPERDKGDKFFTYLVKHGIVPSIGHSDAKQQEMQSQIDKGLRNVTHLFCCTSTIVREKGYRSLGVIETAFLCDDMYCELITDGRHLPSGLIQLAFKIKGADRIILVTDSLYITGSDKKEGSIGGVPFIVEDGVAKLTDRSAFAGSVSTTDVLVKRCVEAGIPLSDAVKSVTETPAKALGIKKGLLKKGYDADFVIFDGNIKVKKVISLGRV